MDAVYVSMEEVEGYDAAIATVEQEQEYEALRWWVGLFRGLTLEQITAAYLMGYGRAEKEIADTIDVGLHQILAWRETVPDFQRLVIFWEGDHERSIDSLRKRIIANFAAHDDPAYQVQAAKMANDAEKVKIDRRRIDQGDKRLELDGKRFKHEVARDRRMLGMAPAGGVDFNLLVKEGDVHIHGSVGERPGLLEAMEEIENVQELPDPLVEEREPADIDMSGDDHGREDEEEAEEDVVAGDDAGSGNP